MNTTTAAVKRDMDFMEDVFGETIFCELAECAERSRWRLSDVRWDSVDRQKITPELPSVVRAMTFGEQTTLSATQKFLQHFSDDIDFTQWMSVWFYEETRHPLALMRWLSTIGEHCDSDFVFKGRVSTPFMRSRMGTLVTNVISEINASNAYWALTELVEEPVLLGIVRRLGADEARHASGFYRYAARRMERSQNLERDRLDAIKVLHFWLHENQQVSHPVNQTLERVRAHKTLGEADARGRVQDRVTKLIGTLVDLPLQKPEDVDVTINELIAEAREAQPGSPA